MASPRPASAPLPAARPVAPPPFFQRTPPATGQTGYEAAHQAKPSSRDLDVPTFLRNQMD